MSDNPYRRDPHRPTSADLQRDLDRLTDGWVFERLGSVDLDPDQWPRASDGRLHGEVSLDAATGRGEFGIHVDDLDRPPLPKPPTGPLCVHCQLAPVAVKSSGLCDRCRKAVERTGRLPTRRATWFHRRRRRAA